MYMIWTALGCLVHFVDSIVWNGNVVNWAPVWCDICPFRYSFTQTPWSKKFIQLRTLNSVSLSHGLLAVFALPVASTISLC